MTHTTKTTIGQLSAGESIWAREDAAGRLHTCSPEHTDAQIVELDVYQGYVSPTTGRTSKARFTLVDADGREFAGPLRGSAVAHRATADQVSIAERRRVAHDFSLALGAAGIRHERFMFQVKVPTPNGALWVDEDGMWLAGAVGAETKLRVGIGSDRAMEAVRTYLDAPSGSARVTLDPEKFPLHVDVVYAVTGRPMPDNTAAGCPRLYVPLRRLSAPQGDRTAYLSDLRIVAPSAR